MTDTPAEPDWSLLPRDPVRFFQLVEGFDRRELKRRYNELLRRYKPERHPEEFQRIRAAYEQLDSGIRYGLQSSWAEPTEDTWSNDLASKPAANPSNWDKGQAQAPRLDRSRFDTPLHERLKRENTHDVFRALEVKAAKTPYDFYALAVMSDVTEPNDGQQFSRWLLEGLVVHQNDIGLLRLLNAYMRSSVEAKDSGPLLIACSKIIHENTFFLLTEPLWRLLLKTQGFSEFRATLEKCGSNVKGVSIDGRLAFYLQILKSAMWTADEVWIDESLDFVERNFERIPQFLEFDLELLSRLRMYMRNRSRFATGHALLRRMDQALRDYFTEEQQIGDRSVLECQVQIFRGSEGLADAFANLVDPAYEPFYALWSWVSYDVAERNVERPRREIDDNLWFARTQQLLQQIARRTDNSRFGLGWICATVCYRLTQVLCYVAPPVLLMMLLSALRLAVPGRKADPPDWVLVASLVMIIAGVWIGNRLRLLLGTRVWGPFCNWMSTRCYRRLWRQQIIDFIAETHVPYRALIAYINHTSNSVIDRWEWVRHFVGLDFALPVYSMAQQFVI